MRSRELERLNAANRERLARPRWMRLRAEALIHERVAQAPGTPCPCCRSVDAEIAERRPLADLVVDLYTGERYTAQTVAPDVWGDLCAGAETHDIPMRCSRRQAALLLDETNRHLFASGGNRAGKTAIGLYWLALQWLRFGGRERRLWLVASTTPKAFRLLEKLFKGTGGDSPPVLPSALVASAPETHRAGNLITTLVDGSLIDLKPFNGDPGAERAKSDPIVAALIDEAAHLPSADWLVALRGRCVDMLGRLFFASTPRPGSWVRDIVDQALAYQRLDEDSEQKRTGMHEGAAWHFEPFPMEENPWIPLANIERDRKTLDMSKPENQRDFGGLWVANEGLCWTDFDPERNVVGWEHRDIAQVPPQLLARVGAAQHVPITAAVVRRLFGRANPHYRMARATNTRFIIGQDVNVNPMMSVLVQVTAPRDKQDDKEAWHYWVIDDVPSPNSNDLRHAERLVSTDLARSLDPTGSGSPLRGCGVIMDATAISRNPTAGRGGTPGSIVESWARLGFDVRAPLYRPTADGPGHKNGTQEDRFRLLHRVVREGRLHVFARAGSLLNSFATQLATPDGNVPIDSRRGHWDVVMGPIDALSYAVLGIGNAPKPMSVGV